MKTGYVDDPVLGLMIEFSLNKKKATGKKMFGVLGPWNCVWRSF